MKNVTITVTDKMAAKLMSLARTGRLRSSADNMSYRAFELACMAQPDNDGAREILIDGEPYYIPANFSYGGRL